MFRLWCDSVVSTHSRPKAAGLKMKMFAKVQGLFQHTAARRRLVISSRYRFSKSAVSTHSRPKAAGTVFFLPPTSNLSFQHTAARRRLGTSISISASNGKGFNTQPPEGGWNVFISNRNEFECFNTQPPEGGWFAAPRDLRVVVGVSTHSRPKAAGGRRLRCGRFGTFQHTAARRRLECSGFFAPADIQVSTHSRPKAAGF